MTVSVLVPWRAGCPHREAAWEWVQDQYRRDHPDWELVTGTCADGPFNRAQAILDAAEHSSGDVLVVADSDVYTDPQEAIDHLKTWAIPHRLLHRLSQESTEQVLAGTDWHGLPLSTDNRQDSRPYVGKETGTLVVFTRDTFDEVPPDPRFVGWGSEDLAWGAALNTLVGPPWRGRADLVHLWHPAQPRQTRAVGSPESYALWRRYAAARRDKSAMRFLVNEGVKANDHRRRHHPVP